MEKETSCINSRAIINYIKEFNKGDCSALFGDLHPEIDVLRDPEAYLTDHNNWISCSVISKLYTRAKILSGDELAAYKIAKHSVENTSLGYAQRILIKSIWSYKDALKKVQKLNDKWNRNKKIEIIELKKNEAIIRLHWLPKMAVTKDVCLYNQGVYVFVPMIWGGIPLKLIENCCYMEDAPYCEYHLNWPARNRFYEIFSRFFTTKSVLKETINEMEADKNVIEKKYDEVNELNRELNQKIKQLLAVQETGKAILSVLNLENLLDVIMTILSNVCRIHRALIMLVSEEDGCLKYEQSLGFENEIPEDIRNYSISLTRVSNILVRVANTGRSEYVPDVKKSSLRKENILLVKGKPTSIYVVPLITRSKVIGVIATDAVNEEGVPDETRETLEVFAPQIAIAIENARLYSELQEQVQKLQRSHALLSRAEKFSFLGNLAAKLAHEIKNPMTSIVTFLQLLPNRYDDKEFRENFYQIALEETDRVNNLISELLDLVKKKESHFELNNIHALIDKMILLISPKSNAKKIEIIRKFDENIGQAFMDAEKIKQVILNLLSNAINFTHENGRIEILSCHGKKDGDDEKIFIEIKDNGEGISDSIIDKIFDPYFSTKQESSTNSGTGLGLFIAHQNIQDHGGTIEARSKVNEGTTFIITLPYKTSE